MAEEELRQREAALQTRADREKQTGISHAILEHKYAAAEDVPGARRRVPNHLRQTPLVPPDPADPNMFNLVVGGVDPTGAGVCVLLRDDSPNSAPLPPLPRAAIDCLRLHQGDSDPGILIRLLQQDRDAQCVAYPGHGLAHGVRHHGRRHCHIDVRRAHGAVNLQPTAFAGEAEDCAQDCHDTPHQPRRQRRPSVPPPACQHGPFPLDKAHASPSGRGTHR